MSARGLAPSNKKNYIQNPYMSSTLKTSGAEAVKYVPRGGNDYSAAAKAMAGAAPIAAPPPITNPTTRKQRIITNSDSGGGGVVDSNNRAGRKARKRETAFASEELLG